MFLLDLTLPSPEENLALDEALLEEAERGGRPRETLRFWESPQQVVVLGRSSHLSVEVRQDACRQRGVAVLRRASGGAAVVAGPGCLMYALVLSYELRPDLRSIDAAHRWVMGRLRSALAPLAPGIELQGTCDLALDGKKVSGNALRCRREHLLYHGTLLYDFPLELIEVCLGPPPREPAYRAGRGHAEFVANLPVAAELLRPAIAAAFGAGEPADPPRALIDVLVAEKYSQPQWHERY